MTWTVEWSMNFEETEDVPTPLAAAEAAWESMRREDSIANVFEVSDDMDMTVQVDLASGELGQRVWVPDIGKIAELAEWMAAEQWEISEIIEMIRRPHKYADEYSKMVADFAFDIVAKEPEAIEEPEDEDISVPSVTVVFIPQGVPEEMGDQDWIVSAETVRAIARQLVGREDDWAWVRDDERAPQWISNWHGPFEIQVMPDGHLFEQGVWSGECKLCGHPELDHPQP